MYFLYSGTPHIPLKFPIKALMPFSSCPLSNLLPFWVTVLIPSSSSVLLSCSDYLQPSTALLCLHECMSYPPSHQVTAFSSLPNNFHLSVSHITLRDWIATAAPIHLQLHLSRIPLRWQMMLLSVKAASHPSSTQLISTSRFGCLVLGTKPRASVHAVDPWATSLDQTSQS